MMIEMGMFLWQSLEQIVIETFEKKVYEGMRMLLNDSHKFGGHWKVLW